MAEDVGKKMEFEADFLWENSFRSIHPSDGCYFIFCPREVVLD